MVIFIGGEFFNQAQASASYALKSLSSALLISRYILGRALAVPQIFGTRSVPRSLPKKGTRSILRSYIGKSNAFRSSFLRKGTVVLFSFLKKKCPKLLTRICSLKTTKST